jgi:hypothetical protein
MARARHMSVADLTIRDTWELVKHAVTAVIACVIIFVLPYILFSGAEHALEDVAGEDGPRWMGIGLWLIVLYFVISNLSEVADGLSRFFGDVSKMTQNMSFLKKGIIFAIFAASLYGWRHFPVFTFFLSVLVVIPGGLTYDKYRRILNEKISIAEPEE